MPRTATRARPKRIPRTHVPEGMTTREWQLGLRKQFAGEQRYKIENRTGEPVFSEFAVYNPATQREYRVAIRGDAPHANYCSCPDYAINTLGSCKHIEAVLNRLRRRNRAELKRGYQPKFSEVYIRYGARRDVCVSLAANCPARVRAAAQSMIDESGVVATERLDRLDELARIAAETNHDLRIYPDTLALIAEVRDARTREVRLRGAFRKDDATAWKKLLKVELFPYQREGALFAAKAGRGIIADDMGLGKTIQAIAAAEILARKFAVERVLVICPTSLKSQWKAEIEKFSGRSACVVAGGQVQRAEQFASDSSFFKIVNYDVIHRDLKPIAAWSPDLVILDEAQRIKNWQTRAAKTVKQIASRYAIVLTGTPLENRLDELHSIVEFIDRHRLGPLFAFKESHEIREQDSTKVIGYRDLNRIQESLAPILIRRTKQEVLKQLPDRLDKNFFVQMTEQQWNHHEENRDTVARIVHKWRRYKFLSDADQLRLRICLQNMRMSCNSTFLLDKRTRDGNKVPEAEKLLEEVFERPEEKVVIFSQWVRMNELMMEMLERRRWGHVHLHGGVPGSERGELVRSLHENDDCRVFLSTDAGGVGLNLQRASTIINMDLPWNPAVLEQRIARIHRLGQKRPVRVVNFIAEGTIEQGMLGLLAFKKSMFAGVLDGQADQVFMGEGAMSRFMKTVETATSAIPATVATPVEPETDARDAATGLPIGPESEDGAVSALSGNGAGIATAAVVTSSSGLAIPVGVLFGGDRDPRSRQDSERIVPSDGRGAAGVAGDARGAQLGELLALGAQFLGQLAGGLTGAAGASADRPNRPRARIETDRDSGARELRVSLPDDQTLSKLADRILAMIANMRR